MSEEVLEEVRNKLRDIGVNFLENANLLENTAKELIWFLEHPSIYTSGRGNPVNQNYINKIPIYNSGRGGKITWHGPGQRIIYFIIDLKKRGLDIRRFVNNIEKFIIESLLELDIKAYKKNNIVGIWTLDKEKKEAKIGSLGLRVRKGIIYHGLSLNVSCDLSNFYKIDPCGIKDSRVTSVKNLKNLVNKNEVDEVLKRKLKILFY